MIAKYLVADRVHSIHPTFRSMTTMKLMAFINDPFRFARVGGGRI